MTLSAEEQFALELINRARLDPLAEAARLGIDLNDGLAPGTLDGASRQVLAPNALLEQAADGHGQWMRENNSFTHEGPGGNSPRDRMEEAGYLFTGAWSYAENLAFYGVEGYSMDMGAAIAIQSDMLFRSPDHRVNLLTGSFREVGVAQVITHLTDPQTQTIHRTSLLIEDFAASGSSSFLTGVVYVDVDRDGFYSVGEGWRGTRITLAGVETVSSESGGYALTAGPSGWAEVTTAAWREVNMRLSILFEGENVKLDIIGRTVRVSADTVLHEGVTRAELLGAADLSLRAGDSSTWLSGNSGANTLEGGLGYDTIFGGAGDDLIYGGAGYDMLRGDAGNDTIYGGTSANIGGGAGDDLIYGGYQGNVIWAGEGNDTIYGGGADDVIYGGTGRNVIYGGDGWGQMYGGDLVFGGDGRDLIYAGTGDDIVRGNDGSDTIWAGEGDDDLAGGAGDDLIYGESGSNIIWAGAGNDTVQGGTGSDTIYGGAGNNRLFGNDGNDLIHASPGGDFIGGGAGNDTIYGAEGADTIYLGLGNDSADGGAGNDMIYGGTGANRIHGGLGDDTIVAGTGRDVMTGGDGADVFIFSSADHVGIGAGRDMITDFETGIDRIDLSAMGTHFNGEDGLLGGGQKSFYYFAPTGLLIGDRNGDGIPDWVLELQNRPAVFGAGDVLL